jgi:hypothetical protein
MKTLFTMLALLVTLTASASFAQDETGDDFYPDHWAPGLHLFAGGGLNTSFYSSEHERVEGGVGLNLKTDLVYFFDENWGADWGSAVKFNRIDGLLMWDTQFTLGVRRRIPSEWVWNLGNPYARIFAGRSPTVVFLDGDDIPGKVHDDNVNRIQFDGSVYGITVGNLAKTKAGTMWFSELSLTYQKFENESEIKMDGDVPVVMREGPADADSQMWTLTFSIGALVF